MTLTLGPCYGSAESVPAEWITITPIYCAGISAHIVPLEGWDFGCNQLCIHVEDEAGNVYEECQEFFIIDDVPPIDTIPPCGIGCYPAEDEIVTGPLYNVGLTLCDLCEPGRAFSGVDPTSITMTISGSAVETRHEPVSDCYGFEVWYSGSLTTGEYTVCVEAMDYAGNSMEVCWSFEVSGGDTTYLDVYPPCTDTPFWAGDTIRSDMELNVIFCDICEPHVPHDVSGVDPSSFEITVGACGTTGRLLSEREYTL